jgi:uncharacterized protein YqjF (DUF2071 family)
VRRFLTAEWRYLLMLNYAVEPDLLRPYVPHGVELDAWNGTTFLSMVGFLFQRTRISGFWVPWHSDFEEVNLRFYVRGRTPEGWRRAVVFVKEIVPRPLIANVARFCYNEPYAAMPMGHSIDIDNGRFREGGSVEYRWCYRGHWNSLRAITAGNPEMPRDGSQEEFITEHYWGYTAQRKGGCKIYQVEHPRWAVWRTTEATLRCDTEALYGPRFVEPLHGAPRSAFVAEGSPVTVGSGTLL